MYYINMYDKNNERLEVGDIVFTIARQVNSRRKEELAIINDIDPQCATVLIADKKMPMPYLATPVALRKAKESEVKEKDRLKLESVNDLFNKISKEIARV